MPNVRVVPKQQVSECIWAATGLCCICSICAGWVTVWNFQKIPAEIILGHERVFVYVASKWWSSVYLEDLAAKCISCVCVAAVTVFFCNVGKNYNTASVLAVCVEYAHWRLEWCLAGCECVYPWWWLRYNNVWLYQTVSVIVLGRRCVLCGCVYAIVTKTVFGSTCESALQRWQSCFSFFFFFNFKPNVCIFI